jgi:putative tryptophan/tyrosine transport system substrate-binding protein
VIDRRAFIGSLFLGALAGPGGAPAQPARKVYRIGLLGAGQTSDMVGPQPRSAFISALLHGLRDLGYAYGEHFVTEARGAESKPARLPGLAAELVRLQVDVIVAGQPALSALKQATSTIPIVMGGAGDPVGQGFIQNLARPGSNFTGMSLQTVDTTGKRLEILKELVPGAAPVAFFWDPRMNPQYWQAAEAAARERGWKLLSLEIRDAGEIERAFKTATDARVGALLVGGSAAYDSHARRIADLAAKNRLPAMYSVRFYVDAGGLMSYSADLIEIYRRAAVFVDKIFKGAKPADLPIEQPTKFELVINLKAAKSIGLTIPPQVLSRADEVIQ